MAKRKTLMERLLDDIPPEVERAGRQVEEGPGEEQRARALSEVEEEVEGPPQEESEVIRELLEKLDQRDATIRELSAQIGRLESEKRHLLEYRSNILLSKERENETLKKEAGELRTKLERQQREIEEFKRRSWWQRRQKVKGKR